MATRKEYVTIDMKGMAAPSRGEKTIGGTVIADYYDFGTEGRRIVVKMPKVERKPKPKQRKAPTAKQIEQSNEAVLSS